MPSLKDRPQGIPVNVGKGTGKDIILKRTNQLFYTYQKLRSDDRAVLDSLLQYANNDTNQLMLGGATLDAVIGTTGYTEATIRNCIVSLVKQTFIMKTPIQTELLINPTFAIKGNELAVWKFIQSVEYCGNVPREVLFYSID